MIRRERGGKIDDGFLWWPIFSPLLLSGKIFLDLFSNFKCVSWKNCFDKFLSESVIFSFCGPYLVSRLGEVGWTKSDVKISKWLIQFRTQKRCLCIKTTGWWSWKLKSNNKCVTTYLSNALALKMNEALNQISRHHEGSFLNYSLSRTTCGCVWRYVEWEFNWTLLYCRSWMK